MSFLDEVIAAVGNSGKLDAGTKGIVTDFLTGNRALLEALGGVAVAGFFEVLHTRGAAAAWDVLTGKMDEGELLGLLQKEGPELEGAVDRRGQAVAHVEQFAEAVGAAALRVILPMVMGAL